jgi:hypothetical protein
MRNADGQKRDLPWRQMLVNEICKRHLQIQPAQTVFDCNFPKADDADEFLISGIRNGLLRRQAEFGIRADELQQRVRVQQQPHY